MKNLIIIIFVFSFGCRQIEQSKIQSIANTPDDCILNYSIQFADSMILSNAKNFNKKFSNNDSCYLIFLDNLLKRCCNSNNVECLIIIDSLSRISDGYVGEYFADNVGLTLFENCFNSVLKYLSNIDHIDKNSVISLIIHSLKYNIEISKRFDKRYITDKLNQYYENEHNLKNKEIISYIINKI